MASAIGIDAAGDKCGSCVELFELIKELNGNNLTDQDQFGRDINVACDILIDQGKNTAVRELCSFIRSNIKIIFHYVHSIDEGLNPEKDCWLFFRCKRPTPTQAPPAMSYKGVEITQKN
ncbi:unnamed protein product [Bursaphelenchus xylophilus]|uniref:(pine wood nematode) hypothetical protein n=1 Tax=Bursaphelenchus xylophilus TaxID=6326 RepID=A0A1I7RYK2_BURXY|nr:unnamed protein product [Bursaphelenchus xylophilus]CAG9092594.1 unnamed protein product [Bursaphelenchus xylophilus]